MPAGTSGSARRLDRSWAGAWCRRSPASSRPAVARRAAVAARAAAGAGWTAVVQGARVLAVAQQHGDRRVDRHALGAGRDQDLAERALVDRLDLHGRLVGLDLGDHVAGPDRVALALEPLARGCPRSWSATAPASESGSASMSPCGPTCGPRSRSRCARCSGLDQTSVQSSLGSGSGAVLGEAGRLVDDVADLLVEPLEVVLARRRLVGDHLAQAGRSGRAARASPAPLPWCGTWPGRTSSGRDSGRSSPRGSPAPRRRGPAAPAPRPWRAPRPRPCRRPGGRGCRRRGRARTGAGRRRRGPARCPWRSGCSRSRRGSAASTGPPC